MRKNAIFMAIYEMAIYLMPLITTPYIARVLGTYGTGVYSYTYSIVSFFVIFTQLGVSLYGRREVASCITREDRSKVFWSIWLIETIMFFVLTVIYFGVVFWCIDGLRMAMLLQYLTLVGAWLDISWLFFGAEDFKIAVTRNIFVKVVSLILIFIFINDAQDVNLYIFIMSLSNFVSVVVMWLTAKRYIDYMKIDIISLKKHILPMFKMFIPVLATQLFSMTDKIFLGAMMGVDSVGIYENAYKISRVPVAFITTIGTVMLPRMTKLYSEGKEVEARAGFDRSLSLTVFIGFGCACGLISVADVFVPLYLGEAFDESILILQVLSLVLLAISWGNAFRTQFILPKKMDGLYLRTVLYAAITNIVLNLCFIPLWSIVGAAIASVIAEFVICIYQSVKLKAYFNFRHLLRTNIVYPVSATLMICVVRIMNFFVMIENEIISLGFLILCGVMSYTLFTCILEKILKNEVVFTEVKRMGIRIRKKRRR